LFAFALLKEHGIDVLYYAVTALAEKNPNFKQQFAQRIAWLYVESVGSPEEKGVDGAQTTIRYRCYLFEGYKGYLTQKELEKALPAVVAGMPDMGTEAVAESNDTSLGEPEEDRRTTQAPAEDAQAALDRLEKMSATEEEDVFQVVDHGAGDDAMEEAFARLRTEMEGVLSSYGPQLEAMLGKALRLEIDWDSLERRLESVGELLNASLGPVLGGLAFLGQDVEFREKIGRAVNMILLRKAGGPTEHGFTLRDGVLTFSAFLSPGMPVMDPQLSAGVLKGILGLKGVPNRQVQGNPPVEEVASPPKKKPAAKKKPPAKKKDGEAKKAKPKGAAKKPKPAKKKKKE
jgi:hypothetical protein